MDEHGQASVEWMGLVGFVCAVLVACLVVVGGGAEMAGAVVRQVHRALCIVSGGVCDLDRRPCVTAANATQDGAHLNLGIVRIGRDELVLREHRSDGTVAVTYLHDTGLGLEGGVGADAWARARGIDVVSGAAARAALLTSLGGGETWIFPDVRAADRGMSFLGEGKAPPGASRAERISRDGIAVALEARGKRGATQGAIRLDAGLVEGGVLDERTGRRTLVIGGQAALAAAGRAKLGRKDQATGSGRVEGEARLALTTDADGRALELSLVRSGEYEGASSLPEDAQAVAEQLVGASSGARRWVMEQRLDLTDPENLRAAQGLIDGLTRDLPVVALAGELLHDRILAHGVTEVRAYALRAEDGGGFGAHVAAGVRVGGGIEDRSEWATLVDARVRGVDGVWRAQSACRGTLGG